MDVLEAVATRYSCRAFLPTPVPEATVRDILDARGARAVGRQRAALAGRCARRRTARSAQGAAAPRMARAAAARRGRRIRHLSARPEGALLDTPPRRSATRSTSRSAFRARTGRRAIGNTRAIIEFFGAPVGAVRCRSTAAWARRNGPTSAASSRPSCCSRAAMACTPARRRPGHWHKTVWSFLDLPPNTYLFCGMALGYADEDAPINRWRAPREPLDAFASFEGFES